MGRWERALTAAGVDGPELREDYGRQRRQVIDYRREVALGAMALLPARMIPHVFAAAAFMHRTDDLLDSGPVAGRRAAAERWRRETVEALERGRTDHPELRPLLHSVEAHPALGRHVRDYLAAAEADLDFTGFATEDDYQRYVDAYALPGFMVVAGLLGPDGADERAAYRAACRTFIDSSQRFDFVNDLAEDLAGGRLTIPAETLDRHGVTRADLEQARDLPAVRALILDLLDRADRSRAEGAPVVDLAPAAHRPMMRCTIEVEALTSAAARTDPAALLRRSASPSKWGALRLLVREYRRARPYRD
ncbi:phytoene/squalene synthase family protein [Kitasatospora sp. NPDC088391]|uniref:phytoene/squalene synthase family protein n=1 Tax=Kitasatospora sp. NPDC088391 TaxID=3364074 RepID=UPI003826D634